MAIMNDLEALSLFPDEPGAYIGPDKSVSGLSQAAKVGGLWEVIASAQHQHQTDRTFYLVNNMATQEAALIRICDAHKDSGYAKFCVIHARGVDAMDTYKYWFGLSV